MPAALLQPFEGIIFTARDECPIAFWSLVNDPVLLKISIAPE
jgi:hypothetical protein